MNKVDGLINSLYAIVKKEEADGKDSISLQLENITRDDADRIVYTMNSIGFRCSYAEYTNGTHFLDFEKE
jgi:hypothetical protein